VFLLDAKTGKRKVLSDSPKLATPNDSALSPNGKRLYLRLRRGPQRRQGRLRDRPENGDTKFLAKGDGLSQPDGIDVAPDGKIYEAGGGALFRVTPGNGSVKEISSEPGLAEAIGVVVPRNRSAIVSSAISPAS